MLHGAQNVTVHCLQSKGPWQVDVSQAGERNNSRWQSDSLLEQLPEEMHSLTVGFLLRPAASKYPSDIPGLLSCYCYFSPDVLKNHNAG